MARNYANVLTAIWRDKQFTSSTGAAQRTLLLLVTQPDISAAGTLPLTVRRWAKLAPDTTEASLEAALSELQGRGFVLVDDDTEELLVVPFIRWDGGYSNSRRRPVIVDAALAVTSHTLGWAIAQEFRALDIPLTGLPDGPPDTPSDSPCDTPSDQPCGAPPDTPCDTYDSSERVAVVTELEGRSNPQPAHHNPQPVASPRSLDPPDRFDEFYAAYARHVGRGAARKAWSAALRRGADQDHVITSARLFTEDCRRKKREPEFIPHPATWLNGERYDDQPDVDPSKPGYWRETNHVG